MLAIVPPAIAADPPLPWAGGPGVQTPFETFAGQVASMVVGHPVQVNCNGSSDWSQLAAQQRFDAVTVWGFVVFNWDPTTSTYVPADDMQLSEAACWYLDEYWLAPASEKGKQCQVATRITFETKKSRLRVTKRVKVKGKWVTERGWVTETKQVPVSTARYGICPDYQNRIFALQTISHETQHLTGIRDEATAECNGMQKLPWFAEQFGATSAEARQMAEDYFTGFYEVKRPGTPYYLPTCPDPGR